MYLEDHLPAVSEVCAQEFEMEEGRQVMRCFGLFGNSVSSGEPKDFGGNILCFFSATVLPF